MATTVNQQDEELPVQLPELSDEEALMLAITQS
jgi:hypothetical protein